jgi:hypothetical protein
MNFVTARGWEDLSETLSVYEELGIEISEEFLAEYIQVPETAADFKNYYDLYQKYRDYYHIENIVRGIYEKEQVERLRNAPFDEAVSVISLLLARLQEGFVRADFEDAVTQKLHKLLKFWKGQITEAKTGVEAMESLRNLVSSMEEKQAEAKETGFCDDREQKAEKAAGIIGKSYVHSLARAGTLSPEESFLLVKENFGEQLEKRSSTISDVKGELDASFDFLEETFHSSQEMVIFITELSARPQAVRFIMENGCDKFYQYNEDLLFYEKQKAFQAEISELKEQVKFL